MNSGILAQEGFLLYQVVIDIVLPASLIIVVSGNRNFISEFQLGPMRRMLQVQ